MVNRAGAVGQPGSRPLVNQTCLAEAERTAVGPSRKEGCVEVEMEAAEGSRGDSTLPLAWERDRRESSFSRSTEEHETAVSMCISALRGS